MISKEEFRRLLEKYISGTITPEEHDQLFYSIQSDEYEDILAQHIQENLEGNINQVYGLPAHRSAEIMHKILSAEKQTKLLIPKKKKTLHSLYWVAAAVVIGIIIALPFFFPTDKKYERANNTRLAEEMMQQANTTDNELIVQMEDGSTIVLQPGSKVNYPKPFQKGKREVYLEGEAFFNVTKNSNRPFYVYCKNIVTHVLGTSFTIKMDQQKKQLEVAVRTGRVEVYERNNSIKPNKKSNGVILLPNQKVTYHETEQQFVYALVENPQPLRKETEKTEEAPPTNFIYEAAPLKDILTALEKTYGIEIIVENDNMYQCLFTGDISKQDLFTKLNIICQSVNAAYEIRGTKILIKGEGCQ